MILVIFVPFIIQSPQGSSAFAPGPRPGHQETNSQDSSSSNSGSSLSFPDSGNTVSSTGIEEPFVVQQVALASNPNQVFQIEGGIIAQKYVTSDYKNYLYLFVNPADTFAVNTTGEVATAQLAGFDTNNIYWNVQSPPTGSGGSMNYGTIGQDLDTGATSNTLSEWQWSNLNYVFGGQISQVTYSGSYDGGGPTACHTYSNGQERHSVYVMIVDAANDQVYTINGGILIQQSINGIQSTTFITLVGGTQGKLSTAQDTQDCPEIVNPTVTPSLRWYVRTPPTSGVSTTGNFGITGTLGLQLNTASSTNALVLYQFVNRDFQTGFIPNEGCSSCISMAESTNPVDNTIAMWPGVGGGTSTTTTATSTTSTTISSTTTISSSSTASSSTTSTATSSRTQTSSSTTTSSQTTSTTASTSSGTYSVQLSISQLEQSDFGSYYNVQTATFTGPGGVPIQGAQVTYYENCGCAGGYFHGTTDANGQTTFTDTYPGAGTYTEWASITYQGQTYLSQTITVTVP